MKKKIISLKCYHCQIIRKFIFCFTDKSYYYNMLQVIDRQYFNFGANIVRKQFKSPISIYKLRIPISNSKVVFITQRLFLTV